MEMTKEEYTSKIPKQCAIKTFEAHWNILLLCWGITSGRTEEEGYCDGCEYCEKEDQK